MRMHASARVTTLHKNIKTVTIHDIEYTSYIRLSGSRGVAIKYDSSLFIQHDFQIQLPECRGWAYAAPTTHVNATMQLIGLLPGTKVTGEHLMYMDSAVIYATDETHVFAYTRRWDGTWAIVSKEHVHLTEEEQAIFRRMCDLFDTREKSGR